MRIRHFASSRTGR